MPPLLRLAIDYCHFHITPLLISHYYWLMPHCHYAIFDAAYHYWWHWLLPDIDAIDIIDLRLLYWLIAYFASRCWFHCHFILIISRAAIYATISIGIAWLLHIIHIDILMIDIVATPPLSCRLCHYSFFDSPTDFAIFIALHYLRSFHIDIISSFHWRLTLAIIDIVFIAHTLILPSCID